MQTGKSCKYLPAHLFGGLPGAARCLNRSISSSNQMKIFRRPAPTKLILFAGFCAYFTTAWTLQPQSAATSLFMSIFISAILTLLLKKRYFLDGGCYPPAACYFINRLMISMTTIAIAQTAKIQAVAMAVFLSFIILTHLLHKAVFVLPYIIIVYLVIKLVKCFSEKKRFFYRIHTDFIGGVAYA